MSTSSCMIFNKSWFYSLTPKILWSIRDIQGSGFVKFHDILDVYGQPICILQMRHMLLKWVVNNIWYTWLWEFNSKVRVNVLNHKLICSSFGMSRSYKNFMHWFLYVLVHNIFDEYILFLRKLCVMGIKIFLSLRVRLWLRYKFKYLGKVVSNKFWSFI